MNMTEIRATAKGLGVQASKLGKGDLIRAIQSKEGNFPCFETANKYCSQMACCWREACLPGKKKSVKAWEKEKNTYAKKVTTGLKNLKKQLAELEKKGQKMMGQGKKEALADIKKFAEKIAALQKKSENLVAASEDAWKIATKGVDDALDDLRKGFKKAAKTFK